jgi:hypothetical protein
MYCFAFLLSERKLWTLMQNGFNLFWGLVRFGDEGKSFALRNLFWSPVQFSVWFFSVEESGVYKIKSFVDFLWLRPPGLTPFIGLASAFFFT